MSLRTRSGSFSAMSEVEPMTEMSVGGIALSVTALLSILVCIPPFIWHSRNKNFAAMCLTFWIVIQNLFNFINPWIWPTDEVEKWWLGPGYCDIQSKIIVAAGVGLAGPLACIFRSLAKVLDTDRATLMPSKGEKRRTLAFEIVFCVVIPVLIMGLHYIVQERRYMIYAIVGCMPSYNISWPTVVVGYMWAPLVLTIAAVYAGIVVYRLVKYKREFNYIVSTSSNSSKSRFIRLFALSMVLLVGSYPSQLYVLYFNVTGFGAFEKYSWSKIHGPQWYEIDKIIMGGHVFFDRWIHVIAGFLLFAFFGFGKDATLMYRSFLLKLGLGRFFPKLRHPHLGSSGQATSKAEGSGSFGSRGRFFGNKSTTNTTTATNTSLPSKSEDWNTITLKTMTSSDFDGRDSSFSQTRTNTPAGRRPSPADEADLFDAGNILQSSFPPIYTNGRRAHPDTDAIEVETSFSVVREKKGDDMV